MLSSSMPALYTPSTDFIPSVHALSLNFKYLLSGFEFAGYGSV